MLAFEVDLWNSRGEFPRNILEVMAREMEIRYSSRTRAETGRFRYLQKLRCAIASLLEQLPGDLRNSAEARLLSTVADRKAYNVVHLIYRVDREKSPKPLTGSRFSGQDGI